MFSIIAFDDARHRGQVIDLWTSVFGYETAHNDPALAIDRKLDATDELFFVAENDSVIGSVMAGYDGHRGWIYSLAVLPESRGHGVGSALVAQAEHALEAKGCVKINLQILEENSSAMRFYKKLGYAAEPRISMAKRLYTDSDRESAERT